jgi:hypothetical protein
VNLSSFALPKPSTITSVMWSGRIELISNSTMLPILTEHELKLTYCRARLSIEIT